MIHTAENCANNTMNNNNYTQLRAYLCVYTDCYGSNWCCIITMSSKHQCDISFQPLIGLIQDAYMSMHPPRTKLAVTWRLQSRRGVNHCNCSGLPRNCVRATAGQSRTVYCLHRTFLKSGCQDTLIKVAKNLAKNSDLLQAPARPIKALKMLQYR